MAVAIVTVSKCLYDAYQQFKSKEIQECGLKDFVDELEGIIEKADLDPKIMGPLWKK